jgi:hypothetical protein
MKLTDWVRAKFKRPEHRRFVVVHGTGRLFPPFFSRSWQDRSKYLPHFPPVKVGKE